MVFMSQSMSHIDEVSKKSLDGARISDTWSTSRES